MPEHRTTQKLDTPTPGPWKAANQWGNFGDHNRHESDAPVGQTSRFSYAVADAQGFVVAHCTNALITCSAERSEANARLIAAAPELLEACETALSNLAPAYSSEHIVIKRLRDAITKAKGESL